MNGPTPEKPASASQYAHLKGFFKQFTTPKHPLDAAAFNRKLASFKNSEQFSFATYCNRVCDASGSTSAINLKTTEYARRNDEPPIEDTAVLSRATVANTSNATSKVRSEMILEGPGNLRNEKDTGTHLQPPLKQTSIAVSPTSQDELNRCSRSPSSDGQRSVGSLKRKRNSVDNVAPAQQGKNTNSLEELQNAFGMRKATASASPSVASPTNIQSSSVLSDVGSSTPPAPSLDILGTQQSVPVSSAASRSKAVRSSQSEEEDDEELFTVGADAALNNDNSDSDSSIDEAYFARRRKAAANTQTSRELEQNDDFSTPTANNTRLHSQRLNQSSTLRSRYPTSASARQPKVYKNSLNSLVKQAQADSTAKAEFDRLYSELKSPVSAEDSRIPKTTSQNALNERPSGDLIATVVDQDEEGGDQVGRMLQAMDRIDAFQSEPEWHFFEDYWPTLMYSIAEFPAPDESIGSLRYLENRHFRGHAFLSGFAAELINDSKLERETVSKVLQWLWKVYFVEPRDDLAHGYLQCMKLCYPFWQRYIEALDIENVLKSFGACSSATGFSQKIVPIQVPENTISQPFSTSVLRLLKGLDALHVSLLPEAKVYALGILLRLGIDKNCTRSTVLQYQLSQSLTVVAESIAADVEVDVFYQVAHSLFTHLSTPLLQQRLIDSIPLTCPRLHLLRRRLALAFFFGDVDMLQEKLDDPLQSSRDSLPFGSNNQRNGTPHKCNDLSRRVITTLQDSTHFDTTDTQLDYTALGAYIAMLDVAIDNGFRVVTEGANPSKDAEKPVQEAENANNSSSVERSFDKAVDDMAAEIDGLWSRISDTGASYMARTDAKNVLERLKRRLEYGVRTKVKKKRGVFEGGGQNFGRASLSAATDARLKGFQEDGYGDAQRKFMENFMQKTGVSKIKSEADAS